MIKISSLITIIMMLTLIMLMAMSLLNYIHPIYLIITLMCSSMMICFLLSLWTSNLIYFIMLSMVMISSLLMIFLYLFKLMSNEKKIIWSQKSKSSHTCRYYKIHYKYINIYNCPK